MYIFDQNFRKSIVCNYRGVCHYLGYGQNSYQNAPQRKDPWTRTLRSSNFYSGPEEEVAHSIDPMLTLQHQQFKIQKRGEQTIKNEWERLKRKRNNQDFPDMLWFIMNRFRMQTD